MIFLSLRNNRKLTHSWVENFRKSFFGAIIAGTILLLIMALDIHDTQYEKIKTAFDVHYMSTLFITMAGIPLTMFIILAMNKHEYGRFAYRYLFESTYMVICLTLASVFYLHLISLIMIQVAFLVASLVIILSAFILSRLNINYKATTMYGGLSVKPVSFDSVKKPILMIIYFFLGFALEGANIIYFKYISSDMDNYFIYQFLIQAVATIFILLGIGILSSSRSLGQSQEVLYYRYSQLAILSLIFLVIGVGIYRIYAGVASSRGLVDNIAIGLLPLPMLILFVDLWINKKRLAKDRNYQGFTEYRLLIKILAAIMGVLVNMIIAVEIKFGLSGLKQSNIDVTIIGLAVILIIIAVPFFIFWKKITKRSSRIITTLLFLILSFILYKFYFYVDFVNNGSTIWGIPVDSIYSMLTLLSILAVEVLTVVLQAKNSGIAFNRYGHKNTKKEVDNG